MEFGLEDLIVDISNENHNFSKSRIKAILTYGFRRLHSILLKGFITRLNVSQDNYITIFNQETKQARSLQENRRIAHRHVIREEHARKIAKMCKNNGTTSN